jgi:heme-degrading monooxygenase HmoA
MMNGMSASGLADAIPEPPYVAVIFSSLRTPGERGYGAMAERMLALARAQPGFLGVESARDPSGVGITVSYWRDADSVARWREHAEHLEAQARGRADWYEAFELRVARVERAHGLRRAARASAGSATSATSAPSAAP